MSVDAVPLVPRTLDGVLVVDKPAGPTSHDVVARVRRATRARRAGHTGTLDPFATGVLPLVLGRATRLARFLGAGRKVYVAQVRLGTATDTHDATGTPTGAARGDLPARADVERALAAFRGRYDQRPPDFSAKKVQGVRAYALARQERPVELTAVPVEVFALDLEAWAADALTIRLACAAGFYVRAFARDLGDLIGCGAHLTSLRRTHSGEFDEGQAVPLDVIEQAPAVLAERLLPLDSLLAWMPGAHLGPGAAARAGHGVALREEEVERWTPGIESPGHAPVAPGPGGEPYVRLLGPAGTLFAIARAARDAAGRAVLHPSVVLV